jgi:hypothetical protein
VPVDRDNRARLLLAAIAPWTPLIYTVAVANVSQLQMRLDRASVTLKGKIQMPNPLDSLWGTVITGIIVTVVFYYVALWLMGA